jgi:outer membrane protein
VQYDAPSVPILQLGLSSTTLTEQQLYDYGQNFIRTRLATVPGISVPLPYGGKVRGVMVDLNPAALFGSGYGTVLGQLFQRNYPSYGIGLQLTLPLRNRVAQADAVRDELQVRQAQVRRQQLLDQLRLEVADAEESVRQAQASYDAAVEARRLQEQSVNVEQQTFDVGLSTNLTVIQYQNYLAQARSTEVASKGAYIKAQIALERATGAILDIYHVAIDEAYKGKVARPPSAIPGSAR